MGEIRKLQLHKNSLRVTIPAAVASVYQWRKGDWLTLSYDVKQKSVTFTKVETHAHKNPAKNPTD